MVGTGQHQVRTYHMSQRRPKLVVQFGEARITTLAPTADGESLSLKDLWRMYRVENDLLAVTCAIQN